MNYLIVDKKVNRVLIINVIVAIILNIEINIAGPLIKI